MAKSTVIKRSVRIAGHATSVSLEAAFWEALCEIAARRQVSVSALLAAIDAARDGNLSSAVRLFVLTSCRRGELGERAEEVAKGAPPVSF
jgi:predicted DNA-binding ribbon-helix-helix protein